MPKEIYETIMLHCNKSTWKCTRDAPKEWAENAVKSMNAVECRESLSLNERNSSIKAFFMANKYDDEGGNFTILIWFDFFYASPSVFPFCVFES